MSWFHFQLAQALTSAQREELEALAGPKVSRDGRRVSAGSNCAWLVQRYLAAWQTPVKRVDMPPPVRPPLSCIPDIAEMRERVSGFEKTWPHYLMPWQQQLVQSYGHYAAVRVQWPPGAGKTLGAICWSLLDDGPVLFTTAAKARRTIAADVKRFTTADYFILEGQKPKPIPRVRFIITGWDTLAYHVEALREFGFGTIVFDEIHRAGGHKHWDAIPKRDAEGVPVFDAATGKQVVEFSLKRNMAASARLVSESPSVKRRLGLTATPIPDRLRQLWGQLNLVEPGQWAQSPYKWFIRYCNGHTDGQNRFISSGRGPQERIDELNVRLSLGLFHVPYSVTHRELPPKRRQVIYIGKDELLKDEGAEARALVRDASKGSGSLLAHARLAAAAARKRSAVIDSIVADQEGGQHKFVVLTGLRGEAAKLADQLRRKLPDMAIWAGTGDQTVAQRDRIREEYMAHPGPCGIVGTVDAWGESLNLQDTDDAYVAMLPISPGKVGQMEGRFSRVGQTRPCLIRYFIAEGTYDEHVASLLLDKLPAVEHVARDEELGGFGRSIAGLDDPEKVERELLAKLLGSAVDDEDDNR